MKTIFHVRYLSEWYNKNNPLAVQEGCIFHSEFVKWEFENNTFEFLRKDPDFITHIYVSQQFILVLYAEEEKYSKTHHYPYNLVLYNLKKEVIKVIPPPKPKEVAPGMAVTGLGDISVIEDKKYIRVYMEWGNINDTGYQETHYLDMESFEFHPSKYEVLRTRGK